MTSFYGDMQSLASELFEEFTQGNIIYVRLTAAAGATPDAPLPSTETQHTINATVRGVSFRYIQRGLALSTDLQVSFAGDALAFAPAADDFVIVDGVRYKIVQDVSKPSAGTVAVHTVIIRK